MYSIILKVSKCYENYKNYNKEKKIWNDSNRLPKYLLVPNIQTNMNQ